VSVRRQQQDAFTSPRAAEFLSEKEIVAQSGARRDCWPAMVARELIDNALDAAEEIGLTPRVHVEIEQDSITVADRGPGIEADTVRRITDFTTRTSSREAWVAPTRGRLKRTEWRRAPGGWPSAGKARSPRRSSARSLDETSARASS
jgi:hypothetical protein